MHAMVKTNLHGVLDGLNSSICRQELVDSNLFVLILFV